jgi:hypothetical protein
MMQLQQSKQTIVALARQTLKRRFVPANPLGLSLTEQLPFAYPFRWTLLSTQPK